ncbi:MAG: hypothetical protein IPK80_18365 [Nannocystis sp.]|nr:hypothetical protein [Nannocystis sp.]
MKTTARSRLRAAAPALAVLILTGALVLAGAAAAITLAVLAASALVLLAAALLRPAGAPALDPERLGEELEEQRQLAARLRRERAELERDAESRLIALQATNRALQREVNDRRLAEEQALEASRTKSAFLANVSHELRTPLNAIIGLTELLTEEAVQRGEGPQHLQDQRDVLASAQHLLTIIDDVLDLTRIEAGKLEVQLEIFQVSELIESLGDAALPLARKGNNTIKLKYGRDLGYIKTDRTKLRRLLFNLLSNACKFTKDGRIELRVDPVVQGDRRYFCFSVTDTGIGIGHETMERLFKPFSQADDSSTRSYGGLGLGLALAKHYAELLGGEINLDSRIGEGSVFRVQIPVEPADPRESGHILVSMY